MDRAAVRTIGLELGAIQISEQRVNFARLQDASDADRAVAGELLEQILEGILTAHREAALAHALQHVREQLGTVARTEHGGRALQQERSRPERLDLEAHRAELR